MEAANAPNHAPPQLPLPSVTQDPIALLALPLPPHAVPSAVEAARQHARQLPFRHKLQLLCTAAASGSEANVEVALAALQSSVFPELFQTVGEDTWRFRYGPGGRCVIDPALAAVKAGHTHTLSLLVERCPALVHPVDVLEAAARDCSLVELQLAWNAFRGGCSSSSFYAPEDVEYVLNAAAESGTGDALAKMGWVLAVGEGRCRPGYQTLLAAVRSGDPARVQWVRDNDGSCDLAGSITAVLESALQHADLAMAQWLVHETGCDLSKDNDGWLGMWMFTTLAASRSADGAAKHRWLREQGAVIMSPEACVLAAMKRGHLETARYLLNIHCPSMLQRGGVYDSPVSEVLGEGGSVPMAEYLHQAGVEFDLNAFAPACAAGHLDLIRWLVREAGMSAAGGLGADRPVAQCHTRGQCISAGGGAAAGFGRLRGARSGRGAHAYSCRTARRPSPGAVPAATGARPRAGQAGRDRRSAGRLRSSAGVAGGAAPRVPRQPAGRQHMGIHGRCKGGGLGHGDSTAAAGAAVGSWGCGGSCGAGGVRGAGRAGPVGAGGANGGSALGDGHCVCSAAQQGTAAEQREHPVGHAPGGQREEAAGSCRTAGGRGVS